jgi:predicted nucleic acid-binding protein
VLYPRILRDYLLYSASNGIISITWSDAILDEAVEHLIENVDGFTAESGNLLKQLMNDAYPLAQIEPDTEDYLRLQDVHIPDENDRHVLAAALAAEADVLCTANIKDFPDVVMSTFGIEVLAPDSLICVLIANYPDKMLLVHQASITRLRGATDESTIEALRLAGASKAAKAMSKLIRLDSKSKD